jgi:hypothetical protein
VYGQQQEIPISLLQTHPSHLSMKEMPSNAIFVVFNVVIHLEKQIYQQWLCTNNVFQHA